MSIPATLRTNHQRLWDRIEEFALIGATNGGGLNRVAFGSDHFAAKDRLIEIASKRGWEIAIDTLGSVFITRPGADPDAAPLFIGSHLDSQPYGGRHDGTLGVLCALEVLETLADHGITTQRPITVVDWSNEEGARFAPSLMGSLVYCGELSATQARKTRDSQGELVADLLDQWKTLPIGSPISAPSAYVELHIEQGPILEKEEVDIAVVDGVQGITQLDVVFTGRAAHAGTTPHADRADALACAAAFIGDVHAAGAQDGDLRATVGHVNVHPGARNVVPGKVRLLLDLRHPHRHAQQAWRSHLEGRAERRAHEAELGVEIIEILDQEPIRFDAEVHRVLRHCARAAGVPFTTLPSGAGHDAVPLSRRCPTGMLFIPCVGGISHTEDEAVTPQWAANGADVLLNAAVELSI
ncbi:MAG: Zn-dependent hydrolase [Actinomycetaceae bacterium]|nr:Zn-dependent hydrolase [Actinomycetaceae bacterium]